MSPKFTIIIPCYNAENYIEQCVKSALNQDYENFKDIVVDNDSGDDSYEIVEALQDEYDFSLDTAQNLYPFSWSEPVEKALEEFTGDYFTILGADDYLSPDYVSNIMKYIQESDEEIHCFQSALKMVDRNGELQDGELSNDYNDLADLKEKLLDRCVVTTPSVVFSRDLFRRGLTRWDSENYLGAADYALYFSLVDEGVHIHLNKEWLGYYYRWHEKQATWGMQQQPVNYDFMLQNKWRQKWENEN